MDTMRKWLDEQQAAFSDIARAVSSFLTFMLNSRFIVLFLCRQTDRWLA
jgi:hypothetical protein